MKSRLEYNYEKGHFHFDNGTHVPNTFGYETIVENEDDYYLMIFCDVMEAIYKLGFQKNTGKRKIAKPTSKELIKEWEKFSAYIQSMDKYKGILITNKNK